MPKIDIDAAPKVQGSRYPSPFDQPCQSRVNHQLGMAAQLSQFGVNLVVLPPGAWSSQRHWHSHEDEFVWIVEGELVLVEDEGETVLRAGDCAAWKGGVSNGHHLVNRSGREARMLTVGSRMDEDGGEYSDIDMRFLPGRYSGGGGFSRKDGSRY
jgi:uncharacterized cupin superfamily protein